MANSIPYASSTASALLDLMDIAGGDLSQAFLPANLNLVTTFSSPLISSGGVQGLLATGTMPGVTGQVAVLVVAAAWPQFNSFYQLSYLTATVDAPPYLQSPGGHADNLSLGYSILYNTLRRLIWTGLAELARVPGFTGSFPLLIAGMGPGGPLAQLAAVDLRPGQTGPGAVPSPAAAIGCYSFSTPPYGNASFASSLSQALNGLYLCNIDARDFYPSSAGAPAEFVSAGAVQQLSAPIPPFDSPWLERTPTYYQTAFGQALPPLPTGGTFASQPAGFDSDLAYNLSLLSVAAYERFQHPNLPGPVPGGYQWISDIAVSGGVWGALFAAPGSVIVAVRGPVSWVESVQFHGGGYLTPLDWFVGGRILVGLAGFYPDFAAALFAALAEVPGVGSAKLYFTGHDYGGALAALAALDQATMPRSGIPAPAAVYGFGTVRFGDYAFVTRGYAALSAASFQIVRPSDVIAHNAGISAMAPLPAAVTLFGGEFAAANSTTGHALALYVSLLNPQAPVVAQGLARSPNAVELGLLPNPAIASRPPVLRETEGAALSPFLARMAAFHGIDPTHLQVPPLDTAAFGGSIMLSSSPRDSALAPVKSLADGHTHFAAGEIHVRPDHGLRIESPGQQRLTLIATRLVLEPGATLRLATSARIIAGEFVGNATASTSNILVCGTDGAPGMAGPSGMPGGRPGAPGQSGGNGSISAEATFVVEQIKGSFRVETRGGNGGAGGNGGSGGPGAPGIAGGSGGHGGDGGNGGNGATGCQIVVRYRTKDPGLIMTFAPLDGRPGAGGLGGSGGAPAPGGQQGSTGAPGRTGNYGRTSTLTLEPLT